MNDEVAKSKYFELQQIDAQMKQIQSQLQNIDQQILELSVISENLENLKTVEKGSETLIPVHNGIFAKAKFEGDGKLIVNVGSGVAVEKTVDEAKELIEKQRSEIENVRGEVVNQLTVLDSRSKEIEEEVLKSH